MLDVTDVLLDPDFSQIITSFDRVKKTNPANGRVEAVDTPRNDVTGVIQPTKQDILDQQPGLDRTKEHITVWARTFFTVGVTIVTWKGYNYLVRNVKDWRDFINTEDLTGFQRAICERMELRKDG